MFTELLETSVSILIQGKGCFGVNWGIFWNGPQLEHKPFHFVIIREMKLDLVQQLFFNSCICCKLGCKFICNVWIAVFIDSKQSSIVQRFLCLQELLLSWECTVIVRHCENQGDILQTLKTECPRDPAIPLLIHSQRALCLITEVLMHPCLRHCL